MRLAHLYEAGEDPRMSMPVTVDLNTLFIRITLSSCEEMTLTANQKVGSPYPSSPTRHSTSVSLLCSCSLLLLYTYIFSRGNICYIPLMITFSCRIFTAYNGTTPAPLCPPTRRNTLSAPWALLSGLCRCVLCCAITSMSDLRTCALVLPLFPLPFSLSISLSLSLSVCVCVCVCVCVSAAFQVLSELRSHY